MRPYLECTLPDMLVEQVEDLLMERTGLERAAEKADPQTLTGIRKRLTDIRTALGEQEQGDDLVAYWEAQIARGEVPDLELREVPRAKADR